MREILVFALILLAGPVMAAGFFTGAPVSPTAPAAPVAPRVVPVVPPEGAAAGPWFYDPAPAPVGRAVGLGTNGLAIEIGCGAGGLPSVAILGVVPPPGVLPLFHVTVGGFPRTVAGAVCRGNRCDLDFDTPAEVWDLVGRLGSGRAATVALWRDVAIDYPSVPVGRVPLTGSTAALAGLSARGCVIY